MIICKRFEFEAAHRLPLHKGKCKNYHGHSYKLEVCIQGMTKPYYGVHQDNSETGMVMDFGKLKNIVNELIINKLDHTLLNEVEELGGETTAETMLLWMSTTLKTYLPKGLTLYRLRLWETSNNYAEWRNE